MSAELPEAGCYSVTGGSRVGCYRRLIAYPVLSTYSRVGAGIDVSTSADVGAIHSALSLDNYQHN